MGPAPLDPWDAGRADHPEADFLPRSRDLPDIADFDHDHPHDGTQDALWAPDDGADERYLDEPLPTADARSEFSEALYPPDLTINDLTVSLRIDDFLVQVASLDDEQRATCFDLLMRYGVRRLRRLLPWLLRHDWLGDTLLSLLRFRNVWETGTNSYLWESFHWSTGDQCWIPLYQPSSLSWEATLGLVENRDGLPPHQVIDPQWYNDWCRHRVWEKPTAPRAFGAFSFFRSSVRAGESWLDHLAQQDRRTPMERRECLDETFAPFMLPSVAAQYDCRMSTRERGVTQLELDRSEFHHSSLDPEERQTLRAFWCRIVNQP